MTTLEQAYQALEQAVKQVNDALVDLDKAVEHADDPFMMDEDTARTAANSLGRELVRARGAYDAALSVTTRFNKMKERVHLRLHNLMAVGFMSRVERKGEYKIEPRTSLKVTPINGNQDDRVIAWLKENGLEELVEPKINSISLASGIREHIGNLVGKDKADVKDSDVPDELKELFNFYEAATISVTAL